MSDSISTITFHSPERPPVEMLRIAEDGFYVRGVKLPQDENEARAVFDALKEWLAANKARA